jgi:hypothetical protein
MKPKDIAAALGITARKARRILRSFERWDDKIYTNYKLGKRDLAAVKKALETEEAA